MKKFFFSVMICAIAMLAGCHAGFFNEAGDLQSMHYSFGSGFAAEPVMHYSIYSDDGAMMFDVWEYDDPVEGSPFTVDSSVLGDLRDIMERCGVDKWNGFDEQEDAFDADGFTFTATFENEVITAEGYAKFPNNYEAGYMELSAYLGELYEIERAECLRDAPGKLIEFSYNFGSFFGGEWQYSIKQQDGKSLFTASGSNGVELDVQADVSDEDMAALAALLDEHGMREWNGFDKSDINVTDGYSFSMNARFENGEIAATGYMMYPDGYDAGHEALAAFLEGLAQRGNDAGSAAPTGT